MSSSNGRHQVVIVGSGFGGLAAAKNLRRASVDVTLIAAGFKNRVATLARWTIAFLGHGRPERTVTEQQVFARTRKMELGPGKSWR